MSDAYEAVRSQVAVVHQMASAAEERADRLRDEIEAGRLGETIIPELADLLGGALIETGRLMGLAEGLARGAPAALFEQRLGEFEAAVVAAGEAAAASASGEPLDEPATSLPPAYDMFVEELPTGVGLVVTSFSGAYVLPGPELSFDVAYFWPDRATGRQAAWNAYNTLGPEA